MSRTLTSFGRAFVAVLAIAGATLTTTAPPVAADPADGGLGAPLAMASRVATGAQHTCVIVDNGQVNCWGAGTWGQTGHATTAPIGDNEEPGLADVSPAVTLPSGRAATAIVAGDHHTCALLDNSQVSCWGRNDRGQLGYGNTATIGDNELPAQNPVNGGYVPMPPGVAVLRISAGGDTTCVITTENFVRCWGDNDWGQLGYGNLSPIGDNETLADVEKGVSDINSNPMLVAVGGDHTCVAYLDGRVSCWGRNDRGQLGYGNTEHIGDNELPSDNTVNGGLVDLGTVGFSTFPLRTSALTAGKAHTCAIVTGGKVKCWGANDAGQLGLGSTNYVGDNELPSAVSAVNIGAGAALASVTAGDTHTCAVDVDGLAYCWGGNPSGQLGDGSISALGNNPGERPAQSIWLPHALDARVLSAGGAHTCAVLEGNNVSCWGEGGVGQLGYGNTNDIGDNELPVSNPVRQGQVLLRRPPAHGTAIATGHGAHTCVIIRAGQVACWGANAFGQLGYGNTVPIGDNETPKVAGVVPLPAGRTAVALTVGEFHTCALLSGGQVACWGRGSLGRLGNGLTVDVGDDETPATGAALVAMPNNERAVAVTAGRSHTCALLASGKVTCWGGNGSGQLGYGNTNPIGDNETPAANPVNSGYVPLPGNYTAKAIAAGGDTTCAIVQNGQVTCWGEGGSGQLGFANTNDIGDNETPANNPVSLGLLSITGALKALDISVGFEHVCAISEQRSLVCWGSNANGQLGTGAGTGPSATIGDNEQPRDAPNGGVINVGSPVATVSAGWAHTCVVTTSHLARCWGAGSAGRLGYGNTTTIGDDEPASVAPPLSGITFVDQLSASNSHTCSTHANGIIYCWGYGGDGRLGFGNTGNIGDVQQPGGILGLGVEVPTSAAPTEFTPLPLTRILDTRSGQPYVDGLGDGVQLQPFEPLPVRVTSRAKVPGDALAASVNLTVTGAAGYGYLRAYPCATPTAASTMNFTAGVAVANHTLVALDAFGYLCIESSVATHLLVDVGGYFQAASQVHAISPARLWETRPGQSTIDGMAQGGGPVAANSLHQFQVAGRGGVPADATAVWFNLVAVNPLTSGFVTVYPCGTRPVASNLNFTAGVTRANGAMVRLDASGQVCVYSSGNTNLLADVSAYLDATAPVTTFTPARILDTRPGQPTVDGIDQGAGMWQPNTQYRISVQGRLGVQPGSRTIIVNVTAISSANGYVTISKCDQPASGSTVNMGPGRTAANTVVVELTGGMELCGRTSVPAQVLIDVQATTH